MSKNRNLIVNLDPAKPTIAFDTYWRFAYERQNVFFKKINSEGGQYTSDPILQQYKFTNVYRACDRVSQYLIKNVIYTKNKLFSERDVFLRIMLFKLFNKIETCRLLEHRFDVINESTFSVTKSGDFLDSEMNRGRTLYSNAYMMASGCKEFNVTRKHHAHLLLLELMLKHSLPEKIIECRKMSEAYLLLLEYPLIGRFLAYQYVTDINYSEVTNFKETEFTVAGPGARDGIRKCFSSLGGLSEVEIIKMMTDRQEYEFDRLGLPFKKLGCRSLQYIDIQNIFCEVDKYCRVAHPEISGISGRTRIKQRFKENPEKINYFFPPKWKVKIGEKK